MILLLSIYVCSIIMDSMQRLVLFIAITFLSYAAQGQISFKKVYGVDSLYEQGSSVVQADDSGYYVAGYKNINGGATGLGSLLRTDKYGNEIWTKYYSVPGASHIQLDHITKTSDGNFALTGLVYYSVNEFDAYLAKVDTAGIVVWQKSLGGPGRQRGGCVKETFDKGLVIVGSSSNLSNVASVYVMKTDSVGDSLWAKEYANGYEQFGYAIEQMSDSGFAIAGAIRLTSNTASTAYIVRMNKNGDTLWTNPIEELATVSAAYDLVVTPNDHIVFTGSIMLAGPCDKPILAELDGAGGIVWNEQYNDGPCGSSYALFKTTDNGYVLGGRDSVGDFYIIKVDNTGGQQWFTKVDTTYSDWTYDIAQTSDGGYIIAGASIHDVTNWSNTVLVKLAPDGLPVREVVGTSNKGFVVYPNPGRDVVCITNQANEQLLSVQLYDFTGKLVRSYADAQSCIDVSALSRGMYLLQLGTASGMVNEKLVVE